MNRLLVFVLSALALVPGLGAQDHTAAARRLASTATLAAQEYRLGVLDGKVVLEPEVEEAMLFLQEARRTAEQLPALAGAAAMAGIDSALSLVEALASPDEVSARVSAMLDQLAQSLGVPLDEIPDLPPLLPRGADIFQRQCASCHGRAGRGDGPAAAGLDPAPVDLTVFENLSGTSPLDFFRRISSGTPGTAMPAYEGTLSVDERWAVAVYASVLRLPGSVGTVPPALQQFPATARLTDLEILAALGPEGTAERVAAVRMIQPPPGADRMGSVFAAVRRQLDSAYAEAARGSTEASRQHAFDAYLTFEQVEREVRARRPDLAARLESAFADLRGAVATPRGAAELPAIQARLATGLEDAQRAVGDVSAPFNLFVQSFVILLREGLEAILILGAILAFLSRTGAAARRREIHHGALAALVASLLTAVLIETVFHLSPARQELLEGFTMVVAAGMLFYVSYWLLSKVEGAKWSAFVRGQVSSALTSGSAFALVSVAFLAVYREGFETVLFYKALWLSGGGMEAVVSILGGALIAALVLVIIYIAVNRFGVRLPLRPLFATTSAFLYYMAFVFAGKAVAELQEGGLVGTTVVSGAPRLPALGIYPTVETLLAQGLLVVLALVALIYTFLIAPRRLKVTSVLAPDPGEQGASRPARPTSQADLIRALERMEADLAEVRAELERIKSGMMARVDN
jgi:high-affinity iron transporter